MIQTKQDLRRFLSTERSAYLYGGRWIRSSHISPMIQELKYGVSRNVCEYVNTGTTTGIGPRFITRCFYGRAGGKTF